MSQLGGTKKQKQKKKADHNIPSKLAAAATGGGNNNNAFAVLMSSAMKQQQQKRKQKILSRFVLCPAGCGSHVSELNIHFHLDHCIRRSENENNHDEKVKTTSGEQEQEHPTKKAKEDKIGVSSSPLVSVDPEFSIAAATNERQESLPPSCNDVDSPQETTMTKQPASTVISPPEQQHEREAIQLTHDDERVPERHSYLATQEVDNEPFFQGDDDAEEQHSSTAINEKALVVGNDKFNSEHYLSKKRKRTTNAMAPSIPNAFDHMMKESRKVFSQQPPEPQAATQESPMWYFCLRGIPNDKNPHKLAVSLETTLPAQFAWQSKPIRVVERSEEEPTRHYFFTLCSTIPPDGNDEDSNNNKTIQTPQQQQQPPFNAPPPQSRSPRPRRRRWVARHSRLSVPVLKSMLQKSIRRRRPLPSVRIAMELADKSTGDLLRRLPVIVLEDSTLHPDYAFLVWLLMAHSYCSSCCSSSSDNSKTLDSFDESSGEGYEKISTVLMNRVFEIIFEVASCRLRDDPLSSLLLSSSSSSSKASFPKEYLITLGHLLQQPHEENDSKTLPPRPILNSTVISCSILIRSCYGGMKCDIVMLQQYASLWYHRFGSHLEKSTLQQLDSNNGPCFVPPPPPAGLVKSTSSLLSSCGGVHPSLAITWLQVPSILHEESSKAKTAGHLSLLLQNRLECLTMEDVCCEGVDFHCSNIVDHLLNDSWLVGVASDIIFLSSQHNKDSNQENDDDDVDDEAKEFASLPSSSSSGEGRKEWFQRDWKSKMWHHCSSVNHRLPLVKPQQPRAADAQQRNDDGGDSSAATPHAAATHNMTAFTKIWKELVAPKVVEYQRHYVRTRLVNNPSSLPPDKKRNQSNV
ncbi:hypothetical protein ACA910_005560 [Epithemia clementina (nom. ined.)]